MKKILTVLIFLSILISCSKDEPTEAYYNFRNNDFDKLLNIELNSTIKYENQFGDEIIHTTNEVTEQYKDQLSQGSWVLPGSIKYFYYDRKVIELNSSDFNNYTIKYKFNRFPIDVEQAKENDFTEYPSKFNGSVYVYLWNGIGDNGNININYENGVVEMMINGTNYQNIIIIQSNNPDPIIYSSSPERNVNIVYYDLYTGIVGFDDLNNNQWRIMN